MDSKQKIVMLDARNEIKVEDVESPEARGSRDGRLSNVGHIPLVQVKTEVIVDREVRKGRSLERQGEIEELKNALEERDTELEVLHRMLAERIVRNDGSNKRKFDGPAESSGKKVRLSKVKKAGNLNTGRWCGICQNHHDGPCSYYTVRCRNCGKGGHSHASCKDDSMCYNCGEAGHINRDCPKKNNGGGPLCYSCKETGHRARECPNGKLEATQVCLARGKVKFEKGESSKSKNGGKHVRWCDACKTRHSGPCSLKTMRCRRCGEIGHEWSKCENPPMCYNCSATGHISKECPKEKVRLGRICYSCRGKGHLARDCLKEKI